MKVFSKLALTGASGYSGYVGFRMYTDRQYREDVKGLYTSTINGVGAARVVTLSVLDYMYNLKGLDPATDEYHEQRSIIHRRVANRILKLSVASRGIYFKAGQYLGNLDRIMPREFTEVLSVLQDSAPPLPFDQIKVVLENDLPDHEFQHIDREAIAAASLAQVHKATLKTGETVAVKFQYPFLATQSKADYKVLRLCTKVCNRLLKYYDYQDIDLLKLWKTFRDMIASEIDFMYEKRNAEKTRQLFKDNPDVKVPKFYSKMCCSRILTMEFVNGVKINDIEGLEENGFTREETRKLLMNTFAHMIFHYGHVHCDPHPGNLLITRGPSGKAQLILLDHGFYRTMPVDFKLKFCELWKALVELNYDKVKEVATEFGLGNFYKYLPLILTYRTVNSKKPLGAIISEEEKRELHVSDDLSFDKISRLMQSLPPDIMFIVRTSNLVAIHNRNLGGCTKDRLVLYTDYAFESLYTSKLQYYFQKFLFWMRLFLHTYFPRLLGLS